MTSITVQPKILRRERTPAEYDTYRAALEWDLIDPIVIQDRADLKSEDVWKDRIEPYTHQVTNLITFCRRLPVTLLADDVGLGKTISAGLVVTELQSRSRVNRILVVAPKILGPQWKEELESKFGISAEVVTGRELVTAEPDERGAIITTYNSARLYLDKLPKDRFEMLILDEAHKLRNLYGVEKPPQVAVRFQKALEERRFRFVLMLTATPIQNRLWDLYSLIDLLSVARGHKNPFGAPGLFARKYIADDREKARQLKAGAKDEFRSVVYSYMSRVRRGDAKLYFPDRVIRMHKVAPTSGELQLIATIAKPIQKLNVLAQISILQALASSPEALSAQLDNMAAKGSISPDLAANVRGIVRQMPITAKLNGVGALIERLRKENPKSWRVVIFTTRRETQTTLEDFISRQGISVGTINGSTGARNQNMLARFRAERPEINVIVSTEAGSEGVNLQVANVLVNYDLPWNPMIVEQRIGRVQRLASAHKSVAIFNVMLQGTFEEYIVGRLMEKLQMASHAIGDIESLLEASGVGDDDGEVSSFEEQLRQLVVASLAGKNIEKDLRMREESISNAKIMLEQERDNIDTMLGDMQGSEHAGPRTPDLPPTHRSMQPEDFLRAAIPLLGGRITEDHQEGLSALLDNVPIRLAFAKNSSFSGELYAPGSAGFSRLVDRVIATGIHRVEDLDDAPERTALETVKSWLEDAGTTPGEMRVKSVDRIFEGSALVRVRATVAHDSYEALVNLNCQTFQSKTLQGRSGLSPLPATLEKVEECGLDPTDIAQAARLHEGVSEFCRFYLERREIEVRSAGDDERKRAKLLEEFTPRLEVTISGLDGAVRRTVNIEGEYRIGDSPSYRSLLRIDPSSRSTIAAPALETCGLTRRDYPTDCLAVCTVTGARALKHLMVTSELSGRLALPAHGVRCAHTNKVVLSDETERSEVTGNLVARGVMVTSDVSGRRAEPDHFSKCAFTNTRALKSELATSEVSNKLYRSDQQGVSDVSGRKGHSSEFETCSETRQSMIASEAEVCEESGKRVRRGVLNECSVSRKRVVPSLLLSCAVTGRRAMATNMVTSSISGKPLLSEQALLSTKGKACLPSEARDCIWSGTLSHTDDLQDCALTGVPVHISHLNDQNELRPLREMLDGIRHTADLREVWPDIATALQQVLRGAKCRIETAVVSPSRTVIALRCEARTLLGMRVQHAGALYGLNDREVIGRAPLGKSTQRGWVARTS